MRGAPVGCIVYKIERIVLQKSSFKHLIIISCFLCLKIAMRVNQSSLGI